ncbi:hypothetical protein PBI_HOMINES_53 [Mycobacterium phage Homines]|nr:hypothetical protein PBI_HOMINES_53 [Mycobacterium phage Homines]
MNPELRAVLTEAQQSVIRERVSMALHAAESSCLEQGQVPGYSAMAEAAVTATCEALASLPGVAVIQLPEPSHGPDGEGRVTWTPSVSSVTATPNAVWDEDFDMTPEHAHELGAALLAAAVVAEGEDK